jgi:hypothetical protein
MEIKMRMYLLLQSKLQQEMRGILRKQSRRYNWRKKRSW